MTMPPNDEAPFQARLHRIGLCLGPAAFLSILLLVESPADAPNSSAMAAVACWMAIWWLTEAVPLAATSLMPIFLFPILGIADATRTTGQYFNPIIALFLGGFLIALAMERWNLHRRIAISIVLAIGSKPRQLVLGYLLASAFLSMWISNTATATMMLPIALAVVSRAEAALPRQDARALSVAVLLAVAYGASLGGIATLVGTPTNLAFAQILRDTFPEAPPISFGRWLILGLPYSVVMLAFAWWVLTRRLATGAASTRAAERDATALREEKQAIGALSREECLVAVIFASAAILWTLRGDIQLGSFTIPGWTGLWAPLRAVDDGMVAVFLALLLFVLPARASTGGRFLLEASAFRRIPWDVLLLFGGGFALAAGFGTSGLAHRLAHAFAGIESVPTPLIVIIVCLAITFLTELTSNTATAQMFLPILAALAVAREVHPLVFMIPATISASMAFMMPVATPPNAIVFGSRRLAITDMARTGLWLNLLGVLVAAVFARWVLPAALHFDPSVFPDWARP